MGVVATVEKVFYRRGSVQDGRRKGKVVVLFARIQETRKKRTDGLE